MDQANSCMKTWIFTLSLELAHPLLLQALVPIWNRDLTVLIPIPILILLSPPPRRLVDSCFSLLQLRENKNWESEAG